MQKISSIKILSLMGGALLLAANPSHAATKTQTMTVKVKVVGACTLAATDLDFGNYDPAAAIDLTANSKITVNCPNTQAYTVALNSGSSPGGDFVNRKLVHGASSLNYNLYKDTAYATVWGDATGTTQTTAGTGNGNDQILTVYGKIVAGQVTGGAVNTILDDTVTVTLNY